MNLPFEVLGLAAVVRWIGIFDRKNKVESYTLRFSRKMGITQVPCWFTYLNIPQNESETVTADLRRRPQEERRSIPCPKLLVSISAPRTLLSLSSRAATPSSSPMLRGHAPPRLLLPSPKMAKCSSVKLPSVRPSPILDARSARSSAIWARTGPSTSTARATTLRRSPPAP